MTNAHARLGLALSVLSLAAAAAANELELGEGVKEGRWVVVERHEKAPVVGVLESQMKTMLVVRTESGHLKPITNAEIDHVRLIYPNDVMVETARAETIRVTLEEALNAMRPQPRFPWEQEAEQKAEPNKNDAPAAPAVQKPAQKKQDGRDYIASSQPSVPPKRTYLPRQEVLRVFIPPFPQGRRSASRSGPPAQRRDYQRGFPVRNTCVNDTDARR